jgi:hypothetical protein
MANIFKFGIEEEFFLVDADTKSAAGAMPAAFLEAAKQATGGQVSGELLQSQVEIVTLPHTDMATAREELRFLRQTWPGSPPSMGWRSSRPAPIRRRRGATPNNPNPNAMTRLCMTCR